MTTTKTVRALFLDVGGVLLTDGWNHEARALAAKTFRLDLKDMEGRHRMTFDTYEVGKLTLAEYLKRVVFHRQRSFSYGQFRNFMFSRSQPHPEMIDLVCRLKTEHRLKIAVVSNEGRELTEYRIWKFKLDRFVDFFISSCFVHFRKPDADIYRLALDVAQVRPERVVYIEDRPMFVQVAETLGIRGVHHTGYASTRTRLAALGLEDPK